MNENKTKSIEFIERYLEKRDAIEDIVNEYFPNKMIVMDEMAKDKRKGELTKELAMIWFLLPDGKFNIMRNPPGWSEFLYIIEE